MTLLNDEISKERRKEFQRSETKTYQTKNSRYYQYNYLQNRQNQQNFCQLKFYQYFEKKNNINIAASPQKQISGKWTKVIKFFLSIFYPVENRRQIKYSSFQPLNLLLSDNMLKLEDSNNNQEVEDNEIYKPSYENCSIPEESQEIKFNDEIVDDLNAALNKLKQFVGTLLQENILTVPRCVEEYCDKIASYKINSREQLLQLAGNRVNKMVRNRKIKQNWNNEDITLLVWLVSKRLQLKQFTGCSGLQKSDWEYISNMLSGSNWQKCKFRWLSLKKIKLFTYKWSQIQSQLLVQTIKQVGIINWKFISQKLYEKNESQSKVFRTAKQCRQHWNCFLNPNIQKGPWSLEEDRKLLQFVLELSGSKKWSEIAKFMQGRTQNALKNRFNLLVNRERTISGIMTEKRIVKICLNKVMLEQDRQRQQLHSSIPLPQPIQQDEQPIEQEESVNRREKTTLPIPTREVQLPNNQLNYNLSYHTLYLIDNNYGNYVPSMPSLVSSNQVLMSFFVPYQNILK